MKYFLDLTTGAKKAMKLYSAKIIIVPHYKELGISFALQQC